MRTAFNYIITFVVLMSALYSCNQASKKSENMVAVDIPGARAAVADTSAPVSSSGTYNWTPTGTRRLAAGNSNPDGNGVQPVQKFIRTADVKFKGKKCRKCYIRH